tara:strand:- start:103 stop:321 length:219 start_codon:yes stop_codon:yes gene_type:complete
MPSPRKNEGERDFVSRCMSDDKAKNSFPDQKQRAGFCFSQWKNKNKSKSSSTRRMEELLESIKYTLKDKNKG